MTSEQLWMNAYGMHYKSGNITEAIKLYNDLVFQYPSSTEAVYAKKQLDLIASHDNSREGRLQYVVSRLSDMLLGELTTRIQTIKDPDYNDELYLCCNEVLRRFPSSTEAAQAREVIGRIRHSIDKSILKEYNDFESYDEYVKVLERYNNGYYTESLKLLGIDSWQKLKDIDSIYNDLERKWNKDNFIDDPKLYAESSSVIEKIKTAKHEIVKDILHLSNILAPQIVTNEPSINTSRTDNITNLDDNESLYQPERYHIIKYINPFNLFLPSGISDIAYVISSVPAFIFFVYKSMEKHGKVLGAMLWVWSFIKAVLWPVFLLFHWY